MKQTEDMIWDPENQAFWESTGKRIASRNMWISVPCLFISFAIWIIWSTVTVNLNKVGFHFTEEQLFTLAAIPGLTGAILRILYSFVVPVFGGRNWTVISTLSLLIPTLGTGYALQDLNTSYSVFLLLAACCGLGGGNFSSSMANISFFFPKKNQGTALGINAGLGNLGVSGLQFITPLVISLSLFGGLGGAPQTWTDALITKQVWLQNVAYIWVIPILVLSVLAYFGMNNLPTVKMSLKEQFVIFKRKHLYLTTLLYIMSFGSFIGFSVALPLLINMLFPHINPLSIAFLGPLLGATVRPLGGFMADKTSGAFITFWSTIVMILAVLSVYHFIQPEYLSFKGFLISFLFLFVTTGIANGSIFRMVGVIFPPREKAPVLGITAAIAALGGFFIPKMFAWSIHLSGTVYLALKVYIIYYLICLGVNWWFYFRRNATVKC
ncbi:MAG: MFS transporter [Legionellales bacterium]|nr:MFS transporter [Legionellales bacterium]